MQLAPTEDQIAVQRTAREFATNEVLPKAAEIDREHRHPTELVQRMAELGFLGIAVPEQYGGAGMDTVAYVLALEEISRACASTGVIMSVNNSLVCDPLLKFATDEQKQEFLVPLASGRLLGCFALSEPEAGSDASRPGVPQRGCCHLRTACRTGQSPARQTSRKSRVTFRS